MKIANHVMILSYTVLLKDSSPGLDPTWEDPLLLFFFFFVDKLKLSFEIWYEWKYLMRERASALSDFLIWKERKMPFIFGFSHDWNLIQD